MDGLFGDGLVDVLCGGDSLEEVAKSDEREDFHPKGDGGSGRRPLPPDHLTFW